MDTIECYAEEIKIKLAEVSTNLKDRQRKLYDENLMRTSVLLEKMKRGIKDVKDQNKAKAYKKVYKSLAKDLKMIRDSNFAISPQSRLIEEKSVGFHDEALEKELFADIFVHEDKILASAKQLVESGRITIQTAQSCTQRLKEDDERIEEMCKNIDIIQDNTTRAKKEIIAILKGLLADKLVLICLILVLVVVAGVVLFKILDLAGVWKLIVKK
jgi:hypothetical protein